jgi:sterol desaturase/sphingolipid hydroxylase (fatty acid hydroxylase superfamily)
LIERIDLTGIIRNIAPMPAGCVSNKNESVRMFENNFLEFCSHVHPSVPLIIYLPVIATMVYIAVWQREIAFGLVAGFFVLGVLVWTLLEYVIHRFAFHYEPRSNWGKRLHFMMHGVHHDYPNDASRLVMPPSVSIPLAVFFYGVFLIVFGHYTPAAFAGLVFGYLCYDMIHYATHHFTMKNRIAQGLKHYHLIHHYKDDHVGFGVSSPLWDFVFGTRRR